MYIVNNPIRLLDSNGEVGILASMAIGAFVGALVRGGIQVFKNVKKGDKWVEQPPFVRQYGILNNEWGL